MHPWSREMRVSSSPGLLVQQSMNPLKLDGKEFQEQHLLLSFSWSGKWEGVIITGWKWSCSRKRDLCERCRDGMEWRKTGAQSVRKRSSWGERHIAKLFSLIHHLQVDLTASHSYRYSSFFSRRRQTNTLTLIIVSGLSSASKDTWTLEQTSERSGWLYWSLSLLLSSPCEYTQRRIECCYFTASVTLLFHPAVWETSFTVVMFQRQGSEQNETLHIKRPIKIRVTQQFETESGVSCSALRYHRYDTG